jgi:hypothetical protein
MKKSWLRITLAAILGLFVLLVAFAYLVLPRIVVSQAERFAQQNLHRRLVIDKVEIHPFTLGVTIQGLHLMEADGTSVFVSFESLETRLSYASITHLAPIVHDFTLKGPYVHFVRVGPNQFSTDDMVAALQANAKPEAASSPKPANAEPLQFSLNNIRIENGRFEFDDRPVGAHHVISDFALGLPFLSTFESQEEIFVEPSLQATINGAPLKLHSRDLPFAPTREFAVDLDFDGIDLPHYMEYLPPSVPAVVSSGHLDLHLQLRAAIAQSKQPALQLAGSAKLHDLAVAPGKGKAPLKLAELELDVNHADVPAGALDVALVVNKKGRIAVQGNTALSPVHADGNITIENLDLLPLQPLFADQVNLKVTRAGLASKGHFTFDAGTAGGAPKGAFSGDISLARLATVDSVNSNDFLNWDALAIQGIKLDLSPLSLHIDQVALTNFFARVIIDPSGRINLQDIARGKGQARRSITENSSSATESKVDAGEGNTKTVTVAAPSAQNAAPLPPITIGKIVVSGGHVRYSDNFIKPRYTADLMKLEGTVAGISTDAAASATVDVHGLVNDAPLVIGGTLSPLSRDLHFDIKASVNGMELAPLSPYSGKYVGYAIERGKLSFDVQYRLENRQLHAENRLVLDQLTFGDKVDSPTATTLPVQLAISLLKDRNGVIDVNMPIGGSLDDPQFSVGGIVLKVILNIIEKAVTAPFAMLGNLFGGGDSGELSWVDFDTGKSAVPAAGEAKLKALAKALTERPGLKLDITGWADPQSDREALRATRLDSKLRALKREDLVERDALTTSAEVVVTPQERTAMVARLYRSTILDAPAAAKADDPAAQAVQAAKAEAAAHKDAKPDAAAMEKALRSVQAVSDDDLRYLGNARAQAAKAWLHDVGNVAEDRMSVVAAKIGSEAKTAGQSTASPSRVEFSLR